MWSRTCSIFVIIYIGLDSGPPFPLCLLAVLSISRLPGFRRYSVNELLDLLPFTVVCSALWAIHRLSLPLLRYVPRPSVIAVSEILYRRLLSTKFGRWSEHQLFVKACARLSSL